VLGMFVCVYRHVVLQELWSCVAAQHNKHVSDAFVPACKLQQTGSDTVRLSSTRAVVQHFVLGRPVKDLSEQHAWLRYLQKYPWYKLCPGRCRP
jgi:hypothetical protein